MYNVFSNEEKELQIYQNVPNPTMLSTDKKVKGNEAVKCCKIASICQTDLCCDQSVKYMCAKY